MRHSRLWWFIGTIMMSMGFLVFCFASPTGKRNSFTPGEFFTNGNEHVVTFMPEHQLHENTLIVNNHPMFPLFAPISRNTLDVYYFLDGEFFELPLYNREKILGLSSGIYISEDNAILGQFTHRIYKLEPQINPRQPIEDSLAGFVESLFESLNEDNCDILFHLHLPPGENGKTGFVWVTYFTTPSMEKIENHLYLFPPEQEIVLGEEVVLEVQLPVRGVAIVSDNSIYFFDPSMLVTKTIEKYDLGNISDLMDLPEVSLGDFNRISLAKIEGVYVGMNDKYYISFDGEKGEYILTSQDYPDEIQRSPSSAFKSDVFPGVHVKEINK